MRHLLSLTAALILALPGVDCAFAAEYGPVQVELRGQTQTWTETQAVVETTDDARFQTERYGRRFSYLFRGLPAGPVRVKLGFCEFKFTEPDQRVFSILANGRPIFPDFDILKWGSPGEAVTVAANVSVPADAPLSIEFVAKVENAKVCFVRVYGQDWVVDVGAGDSPKMELGPASKDAPYLSTTYETCIGKFGSRLCINPRPQQGLCRQGALGHADYNVAYFETNHAAWDDPAAAVYYAVRSVGKDGSERWYGLPFSGRVPAFTSIRQTQTLTSLSYVCRAADLPVEVTYTFRAPFYPRDIKLSVAPFVYLDVTVRNLTGANQRGAVVVGQALRRQDDAASAPNRDGARVVAGAGCMGVLYDLSVWGKKTQFGWLVDGAQSQGIVANAGMLSVPARAPAAGKAQADADGRTVLPVSWADSASGLTWNFDLGAGARQTRSFICVGWVGEPIIQVMGKPYHFKYTELFAGPLDVARWALDNRPEVDRKVALFESTVQDASMSPALRDLLAFAFQSWVQNTFFCADGEGNDWFSVWEGCCKFHSTVDVEYNVAPLYFEYWPELMRMTLQEWTGYIRDGVLSHDMGMGLAADGMKYPHDMEVEENTNFVLLLHHYWRQTGNRKAVEDMFGSVQALLDHVSACDTDGDGFHELGTYNTIDQGSAAVQYAQNQTYLAVRALCAYLCGAQMAQALGKEEVAAGWQQKAQATAATLSKDAWLKDHYVVALNKTSPVAVASTADSTGSNGGLGEEDYGEGYVGTQGQGGYRNNGYGGYGGYNQGGRRDWSGGGTTVVPRPVDGWDGYSIYTTNGMLYPLRSGMELPGLDLSRLRDDLLASYRATMKRYGSPHTDRENNMWVSQNIWRDMAAAYLGLDLGDNSEGYWNLQKYINRDKRGCFTDVYMYNSGGISLDYYPRGAVAFGLLPALAGLQVDRVTQTVSVAPVREPLRLPLLNYADWEAGRVPWLTLEQKDGKTQVKVEGEVPVGVAVREGK
jgi:hypothetical protein